MPIDPEKLSPDERTKLALLQASLEAAVPMWAERLRHLSFEEVQERARRCADLIYGPAGADVLYRSTKPGGSAAAFNALAEGLACASFAPGGVRAFGVRFENKLAERSTKTGGA